MPRAFANRFFGGFRFEAPDVDRLRDLERCGAVVYVMRYSSRLDYLLFNWLFLASGIRLSSYANGITFYYYRPFSEALPLLGRRLRRWLLEGSAGFREAGFAETRRAVREGDSLFLFLRTDKIRTRINTRARVVRSARREIDYLREIVDGAFAHGGEIALVPLALFWRKGAQSQARFLNLFYGSPGRPSDTGKLLSFLWNYRNLAVRVGTPIDLSRFVRDRRSAGRERVLRQVRRSILIFLRREEKPVLGAALRSPEQVAALVLEDPPVRAAIEASAAHDGLRVARVEARARRILREIAARPSSSTLAVLDVVVSWMLGRLFGRIDVKGLDEIVEAAKLHPIVLLPSHRSHFDYVLVSWLFYQRHLVPPLVAAGINLSFWPLGAIFRRAGAFFLRRSFDGDPLYATLFRSYVKLLIKDGVTQEFFIEGTRSRTGKTLPPRLGMLHMVVDAFTRGVGRDVALVPVGFTYERLVEERSMTEERRGRGKASENLRQLIQARRVLGRRFGSVTVRFGEPISLAGVEGLERGAEGPDRERLLRETTARLGVEICRRLNGLVTAGRSAVAAAALLGGPAAGLRESEFERRVSVVVGLLEVVGLPLSENLEALMRAGRPAQTAELLVSSGYVGRRAGDGEPLLHFEPNARDTLAYYRAGIEPALAWPGALALALRGAPSQLRAELLQRAGAWLDRLRLEYFPPPPDARAQLLDRVLDRLLDLGWLRQSGGAVVVEEGGRPWLAFLEAQLRPTLEAYAVVLASARGIPTPATRGDLLARAGRLLGERLILGEALHAEAACKTTFDNALALLQELEVLRSPGGSRSADAKLEAGQGFAGLEGLSRVFDEALRR